MSVEDSFRTIIERSPIPMCVRSADRTLYANDAMRTYLGHVELTDEIVHPDDRERTRTVFARLFADLERARASGVIVRVDDVRLRAGPDGALRHCDMHGVAILHGGAPALVTYLHDHTEQRAATDRARLADRMSALGALAAAVAHQINNPLTYVIANLEVVAEEIDQVAAMSSVAEPLADARTGIERIRRIVTALRTFSRSEDEIVTDVDLVRVVESSIAMAHNDLRHRAQLVRSFDRIPPVRGNEARLAQVFLDLLLNAAQAVAETEVSRNVVTVRIETDGERAIVSVHDNGTGIAPAELPRVFDAFYTTKPVGAGTGLGLFVCHNIVTSLGGTIAIESEHGQWTRVRVALPFAQPRAARRRVLVIDDDPLLLSAAQRLLADEHDVAVLGSGHEALDLLRSGVRYDLVLCDLSMPDLGGAELFAQIVAHVPAMAERVCFMTAGAVTDVAAARPHDVLHKPFSGDDLLAFVRARVAN